MSSVWTLYANIALHALTVLSKLRDASDLYLKTRFEDAYHSLSVRVKTLKL